MVTFFSTEDGAFKLFRMEVVLRESTQGNHSREHKKQGATVVPVRAAARKITMAHRASTQYRQRGKRLQKRQVSPDRYSSKIPHRNRIQAETEDKVVVVVKKVTDTTPPAYLESIKRIGNGYLRSHGTKCGGFVSVALSSILFHHWRSSSSYLNTYYDVTNKLRCYI